MASNFLAPFISLFLAMFLTQKAPNLSNFTTGIDDFGLNITLAGNKPIQIGFEAFYKVKITSSTWPNRSVNGILLSILLLSGDIQLNPGPNWKYPCGACTKPVKINQKGVQCDGCDFWYHTKCCSMSDEIYNTMVNTSFVWLCVNCGQPTFSDPELSLDISSHNSFSLLSPISSDSPSQISQTLSSSTCAINTSIFHSPRTKQHPSNRKSTSKPSLNSLRVMSVNCRSLRSTTKRAEFSSLIEAEKPDIIFGSESHLDNTIHNGEIFPSSYEIFRKDRELGAGGVFIAVHEHYVAAGLPELDSDCEAV